MLYSHLEQLRREQNITVGQLAQHSGIPISRIREYEKGERSVNNMRVETALRWAQALHTTVENLSH